MTPANEHDVNHLLPMIDQVRVEHPDVQIKNANADNGYCCSDNSTGLATRGIEDSTAPRKSNPRKVPKKRQNQRKCIEGVFGIGAQCYGLERVWVRGLEAVTKDTYLKFIAFLFQIVVAHELGVEEMCMKPTFFFG